MIMAMLAGLLVGASCGNKSSAKSDDHEGVGKAIDNADGQANPEPAGSTDGLVIPGVKMEQLSDKERKRIAAVMDKLPSPCGKSHSLRKSFDSDTECKSAPFAARYVAVLVAEDVDDGEIREWYDKRYRNEKRAKFELAGSPFSGPEDAKVTIVEFFDYNCPHCASLHPIIKMLSNEYPSDVVIYYKMFPLSHNERSEPAARAALAASRQGKFMEMHELLFENQGKHMDVQLEMYAKAIGLDMARFKKDYADKALSLKVAKDREEGVEAGLQGTPALYFNGKEFSDPFPFLKDWVDEILAVNL